MIMKKSLLVLVAVLMSVVAMAQAPQKMTYQAVVRDNNGQLVSNGNVGVRITIVRGLETGAEVYSQTETVRTNDNGLFTTMIGGDGFDAIDWGNGPYYLKSEVDPDGGTNYILTTTQQMVSVPYALHAGTVDNIVGGVNITETDPVFTAWNKDYNDLINKPTIPTNISELNNDAGYLTSFTEAQVLSIGHDTIYLTGGSYVKLPAGFSGDYNDLTNKPNLADSVSRIVNEYHLGDTIINYISQNGYVDSSYVINYNTEQGYVDTTYVTNYINNSGAVTSESDPVFTAWDKDYNDLINKPTIPTVPTNVSELANDAGYMTSFTESQILSISNDTIFLTGGSYVKLPAGFSGDYNDLTNKPTIPTVPTNVSELTNDAGYLTSYTETQTLANVAAQGNAVETQIKQLSDPTEELDAVNLRTLNAVVADWSHRFDSLAHRFDSIANSLDSIISYQDSVIDTLSSLLAELGATTGDTTAVECDGFSWYGTEYTVSGDYQHHLTNVAGFDSVLTMHLTINYGTHNSENQAACDSYTWHGNDYTVSGTYTYDYTNGVGCASTDTLHLTINPSTATTDSHTECDSYTWIDGNTYNVSNSTATHTLTNVAGCDSVVTLNLALNSSTHNAETQTVSDSYTWHETTYTESGDYTYLYTNAAGCVSVDTLHLTIDIGVQGFDENGASNAVFTIADGRTVKFSRGNLQYTTTGTHTVTGGGTEAGTWRFAEHQYDYIGEDNANISSSYTGWIDLFGWGTSGWNSGAVAYQPWDTSLVNSDNYPGGDYTNDLTGTYARADWGVYNAISNGGNQPGMWRVLTSREMKYLCLTRSASAVGDSANARYARATVNGIDGVMLFPDTFTMPAGLAITNVNTIISGNTYTTSQWSQLESAGCIFLPFAGNRLGTDINFGNWKGMYWTSSHYSDRDAYGMVCSGSPWAIIGNRRCGASVRLVRDVGGASAATVTTSTVSDITTNSASCGGDVTDDGGATVTARGVCWSTSHNPTVSDSHTTDGNGTGGFSSSITGLSASTTYYVRAYATNSEGTAYGTEQSFTTEAEAVGGFDENGASNAVFSVADGRTVKFSKGNLQYTTTGTHTVTGGGTETGTWRFAEHQYDYIGSANSNISSSYTGWIDLFGWGTSGWNSGANAYQPWSTNTSSSDHYPGGSYTNNLTGIYDRADWGVYNAISNGGNQPGMWRTLTKDEWSYLLNSRAASTINGVANARYAKAVVNGTSGLVIFPDNFTMPSGMSYPLRINTSSASFTSNTYTESQWSQMESAGCIFLPAAGLRLGTGLSDVGTHGYYWSSNNGGESYAYYMFFYDARIDVYDYYRGSGPSVRLVRD